ncbi:hypothetical protein VTK73DRAFT_2872 [Phialemonium thermophilum]|uniref:FAS1 domain-containing protein n=1 Tax=Phialemonium thermophilum TaxID=223376 RepID=A0ABR3VMZ7_9PEZI
MRFLSLSILALSTVASSQLVVPLHKGKAGSRGFAGPPIPSRVRFDPDDSEQRPIAGPAVGPGIVMLPPAPEPAPTGPLGTVMLSDVMGRDRSINIFAGFTRDVESVADRLQDPSRSTVVLAPRNSAIEKLPRKPWEDPAQYDRLGEEAYEGEDGYERAQRNLRRFVEAHIVPASPWPQGDKAKTLVGGREVWWEERDGKKVIQPDNIEVVDVAGHVANGQLWILDGVRNY